jgi:copper transport protein
MVTIVLDYLAVLLAFGALAMKSVLPARLLSAAAVASLGLAFAASGHASTASPQLVARAAVFLHAASLAFWIGALLPLGALLWQRGTSARDSLARFSRAAPWAVLPLIASGIVLAAVQVQLADALWSTDYGKLLLCKFALLATLALFVGWNRFWLTPRVVAGDQYASRLMARSIVSELVLVLAILAVVAGWRFTPPPRSLAAAASTPVYVHIHTDRAMADVEIVPGRAGPVQATIRPMTGDFGPLRAKEVTIILSNPSAGIEPIERPAQLFDETAWRVTDLVVPVPGRWTVRVDILISDFEKIILEDAVSIRR